jgi:hypothetical protein
MMNADRPAYKPYEARLIQLLEWRFTKSNFSVADHYKVGDLPLEIDMVAIPPAQEWLPDFAKFPRLFDYFRRYNIMEVKTEQDRLEVEDVTKLMAYGWLYMAKNSIANVAEVTLTALVHHLTSTTLEALPKLDFAPKAQGIYWRASNPVACVISFMDLPDEQVPEELRAFCDPARRQQTFLSCLGDREKAPIVETIFDLYESEVKKIMLNIREESLKNILSAVGAKKIVAALGDEEIILNIREESLRNILSAVGAKKIVAALGDEEIIAALGEEKIISTLGKQKIIAALGGSENLLKELLTTLKPEQLRQMIQESGSN